MSKISKLITLALGSGTSILLSTTLAHPVEIYLGIQDKSDGICISWVDIVSHQLTGESVTDESVKIFVEQTESSTNYQRKIIADQRGSDRYRHSD